MPVSGDMIKWNILGDIATSQTWSVGIWSSVATTGTPTAANLDSALTNVTTLLGNFWASFAAFNAATLRWTGLSAYFYPSGATHATLIAKHTLTPQLGSGTAYHSPRTSLVVSLLTGAAGRSRRGRIYVPFTAATVQSTLQAPTATCDTVAAGAGAMGSALNAVSLGGPWGNGPWNLRSDKLGASFPISQASVNSKLDTQRRREDKIAAAYTKVVATLP